MDRCQNFLTMFQRAAVRRDFETLTTILQSGQEFLQVISTEDIELVVDGIFHREDGLLKFLKEIFSGPPFSGNRNCDNAIKQGFHFLDFLVENLHETTCLEQYIHEIKDICFLALRTKCNHYIQKAAYDTLMKLIERFNNEDLQLIQSIEPFVHKLRHYSENEKRFIYCIFGKIMQYNRGSIPQKDVKTIFKYLDYDAKENYNEKSTNHFFHMYLDAISDILDELPNNTSVFERFYNWIKDIIHSSRWREKKVVLNSAFKFLKKHISSMQNFLIFDYKQWHKDLEWMSKANIYSTYGEDALKRFYQIVGKTLENRNREESEGILRYFLKKFSKRFNNSELDLITLQLTAYGFSQMAAPCKIHLPEYDIKYMYSIASNCALHFCSSEQSDSTNVKNVCYYQEALSEILRHMSEVTIESINVLIKLTIYTIKRFPDLAISNNKLASTSLIKIIHNLIFVDEALLQRYLDDIIYEGVAWSCSHTLALDAELQRELENLQQQPVCYKNYLPLWTQLLNAEIYCEHTGAQRVARTLIKMCVKLINRLDIRLKRQREDITLSDMTFTQSAMNQTDFRVFTNLVDLYVEVMNVSDGSLYADVIPEFLREIVILSYRHPLISGFYKLIRATLSVLDDTTEMEEKSETKTLVSSYLANTLQLTSTFSNELLITCLYLILDRPGIIYVAATVPGVHLIPAFKIAFTVGLSHLELAYTALTALKTWIDCQQENEQMDEILFEIVSHLEPYLSSTENTAEISQEITMTARKTRKVKQIGLIDTKLTLRNFQREVLLFLGSLGYDVLSNFLHKRSLNTGASWDRKDLLKYSLFLRDIQLTIHFDRILPRVIVLARSSSCRHTRIAACEVLHSIVTLMIGLTTQRMSFLEDSFVRFYTLICPALFTLGCDSDETVRGLYQPFTLQLMHWLSSRPMLQSPVKSPVLDSLFDGLCDDANSSLREFAGICLAEFTRWSIKQAQYERETISNVQLIIGRINHLALHPSTRKRVAAAVAFNHLYAILREDDNIVSVYWLEIFYCFVRSKDGCDDPSIVNALGHIEKVMKVKADVLNVDDQDRRKPPDFDGSTLTYALYWLLSQCGVLDESCRVKCMELYINVAQHDVGGSAQETMRTFVEIYSLERLEDIILGGLKSNTDFTLKFNRDNMTVLLKALDYYVWLIKMRLLPLETLFPVREGASEHAIFGCIHNFARMTRSEELDELQTLRCKVMIAILNFAQLLLNVDDAIDVLPKSLWDKSLFTLTIMCVMHPRAVGFDMRNIEMMEKLPSVLEILLNAMKLRFSNDLASGFRECLSSYVQKHNFSQLLNLHDIAQKNVYDELVQPVNGLIVLERYDMLDRSVLEISGLANRAEMIERIFNFYHLQKFSCNARTIEYLRVLMKLQFLRHEMSTIEVLMKLIFENDLIGGTKIRDSDFQLTFCDTIFEYILTNVDAVVFVLDRLPHDNSIDLLKWIEDLILYLKQHKRELQAYVNSTVEVILQRFEHLEKAITASYNVNSRKQRLISIYGIVVGLLPSPIVIRQNSLYEKLYNWIVQEFVHSSDIEYKTQILQNFLVCLTDATDRIENKHTLSFLYTLKADLQSLRSQPFLNMETMKVTKCFETLLVLLSITGSPIVLDCAMDFAAGDGDRLLDDKLKEHLRRYYRRMTSDGTESVVRSLEITYRKFMDNADVNERFDILHGFLLPAFDHCDAPAIEHFFERNISELRKISDQPIVDDASIESKLVSKIGCYQLIAILITRVETDKIADANSEIVRRAGFDCIQTGRELLQTFTNDTRKVRTLKIDPKYHKVTRLLHCFAYNCMLAILSLKKEERFFSLAFGENRKCNELIWANIVDCEKRYQLGQTFQKYPKLRETTVNIRSSVSSGKKDARKYSYVHNYDLSTSTLNEDINAYDFNKCNLLPSSAVHDERAHNTVMTVVLESDDFNEHECMRNICGILQHISQLEKEISEQPQWLRYFINSMEIYKESNIQLFMLKIVTNMADIAFKPYAKFILPGIAQTAVNYLNANDLNYIITDVLEMLMDWQDNISDDNTGKAEVQKLFEVLVDKVLVEQCVENTSVYNYNLSLIDRIVKKWHGHLTTPVDLLNKKIMSTPKAAVYLILVLLRENGKMACEIVDTGGIVDFLLKLLKNWNTDRNISLHCCECLGLYLKLFSQKKENEEDEELAKRESKINEVKQTIHDILGTPPITSQHIEKQVKLIAALCRNYPDLAVDYINIVIGSTSINKNLEKSCLEILALSIPQLDADNILCNLHHMKLESVLTNREPFCEEIALQIVLEVATIITPEKLLPYVKLIIPYLKDNNTKYRKLVYDTLMNVYEKYATDSTNDENVMILRSECVRSLLTALLDPSQELRTRVLRFWTEKTDLNIDRSKERLIAVLGLRTNLRLNLREEEAYALFVPLLMLQLASLSINYTESMFEPLHNCTFEDYKIAVSWRRRNLSYITPMFVDSLASQLSCTFSQSADNERGTYDLTLPYHPVYGVLRATQDFEFEPTMVENDEIADITTTFNNFTFENEFEQTSASAFTSSKLSAPSSARGKRYQRFLAKPADIANEFRQRQIQKNVERREKIRQESVRQRNIVQFYRSYRIGDFPDIAIPHSSLIEPLLQLIKLDRLICKDVTVIILCSLIQKENCDDFRRDVVDNLKRILNNSEQNSVFNAVVLQMLLALNVTDYDPRDVAKASKVNSLNAVGILLLEQSLLLNALDRVIPSPSKKMRIDEHTDDQKKIDKWTQLVSLYKSLDDVDVVSSIFREQSFDKNIQEAVVAGVNGDWMRAKTTFLTAYNDQSTIMREHCLEGLLEAVNNLCEWSTIDELVKDCANGNLDNVRNNPWRDWMIPYVCDAYVQMLADCCRGWQSSNQDLQVIQSWMDDRNQLKYIKPLIGENLVIFLLKDLPKKANNLLNNLLDDIGVQWVGLSPLCIELGMHKLQKLQVMSDLNATIKILRFADKAEYLDEIISLLDRWSMKAPTMRDNLLQWNKLAACRKYSSMLFENIFDKRMEDDNAEDAVEIRMRMRRINYQLRLDIVDAALRQKHLYIAEKHLKDPRNIPTDLQPRKTLLKAKIKLMHADLMTDMLEKIHGYADSWKYSHDLLTNDNLNANTSTAVREHVGMLVSTIEMLTRDNLDFAKLLRTNGNEILHDIGATAQSDDFDLMRRLLHHGLTNLKPCGDSTTSDRNIGEQYYALAKYCYNQLSSNWVSSVNDDIFHNFVFATLRAMYHDYYEATHYFPCLLRPERFLRNEETRRMFEKECVRPQPWLFLRWRDLLFFYLGTEIANMIMPIVERLAEAYPDALAYTYLLAADRDPSIRCNDVMQRVREHLREKVCEIERFQTAIRYVVLPELYLKYYLNEAETRIKQLSEGHVSALTWLLDVYPIVSTSRSDRSPWPGDAYKVIAKYENVIRTRALTDRETALKTLQNITASLNQSLANRNKGLQSSITLIKNYSPFLHEYRGGSIEIPGQYTGYQKPRPRYHAKIAKIEPTVEVMQSLRKPIRISMIGDNGREYKFLVKFGEDLTIDQGLQQLYTTMNRILSNDAVCKQRRLAINTYEVIPLSRSCGLIQWIEDTRSLQDLVRFTLLKSDIGWNEKIHVEYVNWIASAAPSSKQIGKMYKAAASMYDRREVTTKMQCLINKTKQSALRDTFTAISSSPESFVTLRRNFVTSYATMCVAHWLSGIGDRNLQNTLVTVDSGRCLGIDFGHALGEGVRGPIPELVPFRLTPQILGLLQPFTERHLFATIMSHVMRALRNDKNPILACMDIFVYKPVNRESSIDNEDAPRNTNTNIIWSVTRRICVVAEKLNGVHPSFVMLEELKEAHNDEYFETYKNIVTGNEESKRAHMAKHLTPVEQVDCLLEQATDLNVLGRMYANWQPWL